MNLISINYFYQEYHLDLNILFEMRSNVRLYPNPDKVAICFHSVLKVL